MPLWTRLDLLVSRGRVEHPEAASALHECCLCAGSAPASQITYFVGRLEQGWDIPANDGMHLKCLPVLCELLG